MMPCARASVLSRQLPCCRGGLSVGRAGAREGRSIFTRGERRGRLIKQFQRLVSIKASGERKLPANSGGLRPPLAFRTNRDGGCVCGAVLSESFVNVTRPSEPLRQFAYGTLRFTTLANLLAAR